MIELEENPYERVYKIDSQLTQLNDQLKTITAKISSLEIQKEKCIKSANGAQSIGEYRLQVNRKTREMRKVIIDRIIELNPDLIFTGGKFVYKSVDIPDVDKDRYKQDALNHYEVGLTELDVMTGSKSNSLPYVDIDVKETVTYSVEKIEE